jgi:tRNA modification GTPase
MNETIYALSSGAVPAGIAVVRISGPRAHAALQVLAGRVTQARVATLVTLRDSVGEMLDRCLALRFDGPASATGEDLVELHLHGGRAVVFGVMGQLSRIDGLREAEAGEFTRQALANGRIDLIEAEGLGDLLTAETQGQLRAAMRQAGGALSRWVEAVRARVLALAAALEARLDFGDEDDVGDELPAQWHEALATLRQDIAGLLARPPAERLRDGIRVVIAGPVNAGKSSLLNLIVDREAAIVSSHAGTTRDVIEVPVVLHGRAYLLSDTAGLRSTDDVVEAIGVERAQAALRDADIILWLGDPVERPDGDHVLLMHAKADLGGEIPDGAIAISSLTGAGFDALVARLAALAAELAPPEDGLTANRRQRDCLAEVGDRLGVAMETPDLLIAAEELRLARSALDRLSGRAGVEDMLDALFGRFCIGK